MTWPLVTTARSGWLFPAHRRCELRAEALHQMRVAAVMVLEEADAIGGRLGGEIGHVDWNGLGQVDFLLDLRVMAFGHGAVEQPAGEPLVILEADATVADPQFVLREMLFLR